MDPLPPLPPAESDFLDQTAAGVPMLAAALAAHRQGQLARARAAYAELVEQPALTAICLHQLGVLAGQLGEHQRASELIERAIRIDPERPLFHQNLAVSLERRGDPAAALDSLINLACIWQKAERHEPAIAIYRRVLAADPRRYAAWVNLGTGLAWQGQVPEAVQSILRGVVLHARVMPELRALLDALLPGLGAAGLVPAAFGLPPGPPTGVVDRVEHALCTLGKALEELAQPAAALACLRLAVGIAPGLALAHWNLALALLSQGDFANGWREYEWRWHWNRFPEVKRRLLAPEWWGQDLAGRNVVVFAEQGYGDAIQFAPLASRLAERAGRVLLEVTTPQVRLFRNSFAGGNITVIERHADPHRVQAPDGYDYVVSMMSLPERLGLAPADLPVATGYLRADPAEAELWAERLGGQGRRVGLVWAGRPEHSNDRNRSLSLARLAHLFEVPGLAWHGLQLGPATAQIGESGLPIADHSARLRDFADTAALIAGLELVIAVDTAVAHLAAAMGKPTWVLLPDPADWRWLRHGGDSRWYPSLRLFRQSAPGEWEAPLAELARALAEWARG